MVPETSREALRRSGKRDVSVERRRSVDGLSLPLFGEDAGVCSCRSDWLRIDPPETARTGRGRGWLVLLLELLLLLLAKGTLRGAAGGEEKAEGGTERGK